MSINLFAPLIKIIIESSLATTDTAAAKYSIQSSSMFLSSLSDSEYQYRTVDRMQLKRRQREREKRMKEIKHGKSETKIRLVFKFDTSLFDTARYFAVYVCECISLAFEPKRCEFLSSN